MTHNILKSSLFLLFLLVGIAGFAASEAEYKLLSKSWTLQEDGTLEYRCSKELTIYTHTAMNSTYGESFIVYNPEYQELIIHESYTKQKDGTIIKTPENAFVEVLPRDAADAPAYNQLKEMVVVHTGLELGATIYLDYSVVSKPGHLSEIDLNETIQETSPVKSYLLSISLPESKPLHYALTNLPAKPTTTVKSGVKQVSWKLSNLPASSKAPLVSTMAGGIPQLTASSYASEKEALKRLQLQFGRTRDLKMQVMAQKMTEGAQTKTEKLQRLLTYVADELGYSRLSLKDASFKVRAEVAVIQTAYGTQAEKAGLLAGMLNAVEIEAKTAAVYQTKADVSTLGLSAIHDFVVIANVDGKEYILSPISKSIANAAWYGDYETVLLLATGEPVSFKAPAHAIRYTSQLTVGADKANGKASAVVGNGFIPYAGKPDALTLGGQEIESAASGENTTLKYTTSHGLTNTNGYAFLPFPDVSASIVHLNYSYLNTKRTDPLLLSCVADEEYTYSIALENGWTLATPPANVTLDNKAGQLTIQISQFGNTVNASRKLKINKQLITPAEFTDFRTLMTTWSHPNTGQLLLKTN